MPAITISPYARKGVIKYQTLSSDAYLKFIGDDFLNGARLDPRTDGRPDRRPEVREDAPILGNLVQDFNFSQKPRAPVLLPTNPPADSPRLPAYFLGQPACRGCTKPPPGRPARLILALAFPCRRRSCELDLRAMRKLADRHVMTFSGRTSGGALLAPAVTRHPIGGNALLHPKPMPRLLPRSPR